ncbi:petH, partial [Symbiodinium microadriaticum]
DMTAIAKYEVLSALADGRAPELAEILEAARLPGHAYFTDGWHLSEEGMRAACGAELAALAEGFDLIISDSTLCVVDKEEAKRVKGGDGGRLVNSLVPAPVHPAWGKGFYRGGFCRHLWNILESNPGEDRPRRCSSLLPSGTMQPQATTASTSGAARKSCDTRCSTCGRPTRKRAYRSTSWTSCR